MSDKQQQSNKPPRATEPMPSSWRPLWTLLLFLAGVVAVIALAAAIVDRAIYG